MYARLPGGTATEQKHCKHEILATNIFGRRRLRVSTSPNDEDIDEYKDSCKRIGVAGHQQDRATTHLKPVQVRPQTTESVHQGRATDELKLPRVIEG
jgi:hypothetical protein